MFLGNLIIFLLLIVYVLNQDFTFLEAKIFPKTERNIRVPEIFDLYCRTTIGAMTKMTNQFDYIDTKKAMDEKSDIISFMNWSDSSIDNIHISEDGKFDISSNKINVGKDEGFGFYPAKQGFLLMYKVDYKKESARMELIKINE